MADVAGQLQVIELFLKPLALIGQVPGRLGVLGQAAALGLVHGLLQLLGPHLLQLFLARQNIHGQLFEIGHVQLVHLVQHGDILEQLHLVALQHGLDVLHVGLGLVVLGLELVQLVGLFLEEAKDPLFLLGGVEALQLADQVGDHLPHLAQVFGGHLGQRRLREVADLLLAGRAVLQHLLAVGDVDLLGEVVHHLLLLGGQAHLLLGRLGRLLLFLLGDGQVGRGVQRQGGGGGASKSKFKVLLSAIQDSSFLNVHTAGQALYRPWFFIRVSSTARSADRSMLSEA